MNYEMLRELREKRGDTQRTVCNAIGITEGNLSLLERGETSNPRIKTLKALAAYYGVPVEELLKD